MNNWITGAIVVAITSCVLIQSNGQSGSGALGSPEIGYIDMASNPFSAMNYLAMFDEDSHDGKIKTAMKELLYRTVDSILYTRDLNYFEISLDSILAVSGELDTLDYFIVRKNNGKLFVSQLVHDGSEYFLLCRRRVVDPCECGSDLFIYLPENNYLQRVERWFSFSMKNNLAFRINKLTMERIRPGSYQSLCDELSSLIEAN